MEFCHVIQISFNLSQAHSNGIFLDLIPIKPPSCATHFAPNSLGEGIPTPNQPNFLQTKRTNKFCKLAFSSFVSSLFKSFESEKLIGGWEWVVARDSDHKKFCLTRTSSILAVIFTRSVFDCALRQPLSGREIVLALDSSIGGKAAFDFALKDICRPNDVVHLVHCIKPKGIPFLCKCA